MKQFAKIFQSQKMGQIAVLNDTDDEGNPAVCVYFNPPELGVCCQKAIFKEDEVAKCDELFEKVDLEMCEQFLDRAWDMAVKLGDAIEYEEGDDDEN